VGKRPRREWRGVVLGVEAVEDGLGGRSLRTLSGEEEEAGAIGSALYFCECNISTHDVAGIVRWRLEPQNQ